MDDRTIPRPRSVRLDALGLSSTDAFVLAQIDGASTLEDVADSTGLGVDAVIAIARRLEQLGVIERPATRARPETSGRYSATVTPVRPSSVSEVPPRPPPPPPHYARKRWQPEPPGSSKPPAKPASTAPGSRSMRPSRGTTEKPRAGQPTVRPASTVKSSTSPSGSSQRPRHEARAPSRARHEAAPRQPVRAGAEVLASPTPPPATPPATPLEEAACDLDAETIAKIDAAAAAPAGRTHYAILGVARHVDAKEIRRAYFAVAATLHPDRYFGKRLGAHKKKLEHAFRIASDAYEVLRVPAKRAEYDHYLRLTRQSAKMEAALTAPIGAPIDDPIGAPVSGPVSDPASAPIAVRPPTPVAAPRPAPIAARFEPAPFAANAPRVAPPSVRPPASAPPVVGAERVVEPASARQRAAAPAISNAVAKDDLAPEGSPRSSEGRRLLGASKSASLLEGAQKALAQGDAAGAANLYRLALHYAEDAATRGYAQSGLQEARSTLADTHLMKARYEEKEARWPDAVISYAKALEGRPDDPAICERLAHALRQEGHDLPRATRLAELAVSRAPRRAAYRKTLGLVYGDAGLRDKAQEELEKAFEIDPSDEQVAHALAALRKRRR